MAIPWKPGSNDPGLRPLEAGSLGMQQLSDEALETALTDLGLDGIFLASATSGAPIPWEDSGDAGSWFVDKNVPQPFPTWWERAKARPLVLIGGGHADFTTVDDLDGTTLVRDWNHEHGYHELPDGVAPRTWLQEQCRRFVENEVLADLEGAAALERVVAVYEEVLSACGGDERADWERWWSEQWWSDLEQFEEDSDLP